MIKLLKKICGLIGFKLIDKNLIKKVCIQNLTCTMKNSTIFENAQNRDPGHQKS